MQFEFSIAPNYSGIVASREQRTTQPVRNWNQLGEFDRLITGHAGAGRNPGKIFIQEGCNYLLPELLSAIECIVCKSQVGSHSGGIMDVLRGTATTLGCRVIGVIPQMQRDTHYLVALTK
jgi:hypothetical protein